jgi:cytidylate kinase
MKIAIVGAPGSGKTAFAKKIAKEYDIPVYDNEAQKFTKRTNFIVGLGTDFRIETMLFAQRLETASKYWEKDGVFTQTLIDSLAYQNIRRELALRAISDSDEEIQYQIDRETALTTIFGEAFLKSFRYDKIYHLKMFNDTTDKEELPEYFLTKIVEASQKDVIETFLNGEDVETIKRPPKVRRGSMAKD